MGEKSGKGKSFNVSGNCKKEYPTSGSPNQNKDPNKDKEGEPDQDARKESKFLQLSGPSEISKQTEMRMRRQKLVSKLLNNLKLTKMEKRLKQR